MISERPRPHRYPPEQEEGGAGAEGDDGDVRLKWEPPAIMVFMAGSQIRAILS